MKTYEFSKERMSKSRGYFFIFLGCILAIYACKDFEIDFSSILFNSYFLIIACLFIYLGVNHLKIIKRQYIIIENDILSINRPFFNKEKQIFLGDLKSIKKDSKSLVLTTYKNDSIKVKIGLLSKTDFDNLLDVITQYRVV